RYRVRERRADRSQLSANRDPCDYEEAAPDDAVRENLQRRNGGEQGEIQRKHAPERKGTERRGETPAVLRDGGRRHGRARVLAAHGACETGKTTAGNAADPHCRKSPSAGQTPGRAIIKGG